MILDQIRNNTISILHLSDSAEEVFEDDNYDIIYTFMDALKKNTSLQTIHLEKDFIADLRSDTRETLLLCLGQVSNLIELTLADGLLQMGHIGQMIQSSSSLQIVRLQNIILQGMESDFDTCETILLQGHPSIHSFQMEDCSPANDHISMEGLLKASEQLQLKNGGIVTDPTLMKARTFIAA